MKKKYSVLVLCLCLFPALMFAAPNITSSTGDFSYGQTINITGSGFGTHSLDVEFIGHDIEAKIPGKLLNWGNWHFEQTGTSPSPYIVTTQAHSGANSIYVNIPNMQGSNHRYDYPTTIGYNTDVFISWWVRRHRTGTHDYQWKLFRVGYSPNSYLDEYTPQFKWFEHDGNYDQFFINPGSGTSPDNGGPPYPEDYLKTSFPSVDDRWYRIDILMHTSSGQGAADGYYTQRLYDPTGKTIREHSSSGWVTFNTGVNDFYKYFFWQNWMETSQMTHELWFDDHYIQVGTQARVELCDSANWSERTVCDLQKPISWSDTTLSVKINTGAFTSGEMAYLYIIDAAGNISSGYAVTIGKIGDAPIIIPNAPTNLLIQ